MSKAKRLAAAVLVASLAVLLFYGLQTNGDERSLAKQSSTARPAADGTQSIDQALGASRERGTMGETAVRPVANQTGNSAAPSVGVGQLGHVVGGYAGSERQGIRIAELEALLEANDGEFREREQDIHTELTNILKGDPVAQSMEVRCADGFCRLKLDKPVDQGMAWHEVDQAIGPVTKGEMIFGAEPNGDKRTTAYVYFSRDSQLPMAAAARAPEDE